MPRAPFYALLTAILAVGACADRPASVAPVKPDATTAAATPPNNEVSAYGLLLAGEAALDEGRLGAASDYFSRADLGAGGSTYLGRKAFLAALQAGDVPKAALLAPTGDDVDESTRRLGVLVRGVEAMAEGKYKDANALFTSPTVGAPNNLVAALLSRWAAAGAGDKAAALAAPPQTSDPLGQFVATLAYAEICDHLGKATDAETQYKALLTAGDTAGLIAQDYGGFLERRGRWDDAAALYKTALQREPDDPQLARALARAQRHGPAPQRPTLLQGAAKTLIIPAESLQAQKQDEGALAYLRLALRLDPAMDDAWVLAGDLILPNDVEAARAAFGHVGPKSDRYVMARNKLAWSYDNAGDHAAALKLARETAAAVPASREANETLADLLRSNDQYGEAVSVATKLIDAASTPDWRLYYLRASTYQEAGDWPKAEADLKTALGLEPQQPELLNFLGYSWIDRGEHLNEALAMVQQASSAEPQSGAIIDSVGWGYYRLGDYKTAVDRLEEAVSLEPSDADVNNHLGDAYWRAGRKTEAVFQWRRVLTLEPTDELKAKVDAKLASPLGPDAPEPKPPEPAPSPPQKAPTS
jgi:tetratricopeptide (TPR) repeat protein